MVVFNRKSSRHIEAAETPPKTYVKTETKEVNQDAGNGLSKIQREYPAELIQAATGLVFGETLLFPKRVLECHWSEDTIDELPTVPYDPNLDALNTASPEYLTWPTRSSGLMYA